MATDANLISQILWPFTSVSSRTKREIEQKKSKKLHFLNKFLLFLYILYLFSSFRQKFQSDFPGKLYDKVRLNFSLPTLSCLQQ